MSDEIKKIRSGVLSRTFSVARLSLGGAVRVGLNHLGGAFQDKEQRITRFRSLLEKQAREIARELGELKGSLMKAGQILSIYGEQFLPQEINEVLKTLQSASPPLEWAVVEKAILRELGPERMARLEIEHRSTGSASLGQVHRAVRKTDGAELALKVQYPGVDRAIDSDLKLLRRLLKLGNWVPWSPALDTVFDEVRLILSQEVDYARELTETSAYRARLEGDDRFVVPRVFPELSTPKLITTSFETGVGVDCPEVMGLSQERRNRLGLHFLELYLKEVFQFHAVQTDPHFGNYRIRLDPAGKDRIVCLDFGAVRLLSQDFLSRYVRLFRGAVDENRGLTLEGLKALGFVADSDPPEWGEKLIDLSFLMIEPLRSKGPYDWGATDLIPRAISEGRGFLFGGTIRLPPQEMISLDRKGGGTFILLSKLRAIIDCREIIERWVPKLKC